MCGEWQCVGTIPKQKVPKFTKAMHLDQITKVKFDGAPWYGYDEQGVGGLLCKTVVLKKSVWPTDDRKYKYKDDISAFTQ